MILDEAEIDLLERVERTRRIPDADRRIAYRLASLGFLKLGYSKDGEFHETGQPSEIGRELLRIERIEKNPIRRFLKWWFGGFLG
ncbi:MAG: hypothetical protein HYV76_02215 [Candidatus Vogelbacteria bacterium]|nr:hypothetical protein [Candidatus Vogelbacteria bacterium]